MEKSSSLLYWFPKVNNLGIPVPRTETLELDPKNDDLVLVLAGNPQPLDCQLKKILDKARLIGYPLFMKTGTTSAKKWWKATCYVEKEEYLKRNITNLIELSLAEDITERLPIDALVFREYILMKTIFTGFYYEMPVVPEFRFFIDKGRVQCGHWYWHDNALEVAAHTFPHYWWIMLAEAQKKYTTRQNIDLLARYSQKVADVFPEKWSVDFCLSNDDSWYLIDMALGKESEHIQCPETNIL